MTIPQFRQLVWNHAKKKGRHTLPWRRPTTTAYGVLVSEIMLQQTQVDRVIPYYRTFLKRFPSVRALARAPLSEVLVAWQGLGYNRRAKHLHEAAKKLVNEHRGKIPADVDTLEGLPGIGPYTARAIAAFAYNQDAVFIETNLRTAVMHTFFPKKQKVTDEEILTVLRTALPTGRARAWYGALMDYGAHLKRSGVQINSRSMTYTKQSAFKGSSREARGAILRTLLTGPQQARTLGMLLGKDRQAQLQQALLTLVRDGMLQRSGTRYSLPNADRESDERSTGRVEE